MNLQRLIRTRLFFASRPYQTEANRQEKVIQLDANRVVTGVTLLVTSASLLETMFATSNNVEYVCKYSNGLQPNRMDTTRIHV